MLLSTHSYKLLSDWRSATQRTASALEMSQALCVLTSGRVEGSGPSGASSTSMSNPSERSGGAPARRPGDSRGRGSEGCSGVGGVGGQYADVVDDGGGGDGGR